MDKKLEKQRDHLRNRLQVLQRQLAGAKKQCDDPDEVRQIERDVAAAQAELKRMEAANG